MLGDVVQSNFGGGIWRDPDAPADAVYDAVNALIGEQDSPSLEKRGGSAYVTTSDAGQTLLGIGAMHLPSVGDITLVWGATEILRVNGTGFTSVLNTDSAKALARWTGVGDYFVAPSVGFAGSVVRYDGTTGSTLAMVGVTNVDALAAVGTVPRLIIGDGSKVHFTEPGTLTVESYHELPARARVVGADAIGDTAVLFTTSGVFTISNMDYDPVDDAGNIQHSVAQVSKDLILWGDAGLAAWGGALVVPALDDVVIFAPGDAPVSLAGPIRALYRSYVKVGHKPGLAYVHRGHYVLPIVNASNVLVDVLVCRLDTGRPAWTRWAGGAAAIGYALKVDSSSARNPKLYAVKAQRVIDVSGAFAPTSATKTDADGTAPEFSVTIERRVTAGMRPVTVKAARIRYELTDAATDNPTLTAGATVDAGTTLTALSGSAAETTNEANYTWAVRRSGVRVKLQLTSSGASAALKLHEVAFRVRHGGRQ